MTNPPLSPETPGLTLADLIDEYGRLGFVGKSARYEDIGRDVVRRFELWVGARQDFWQVGRRVSPTVLNEWSQYAVQKWAPGTAFMYATHVCRFLRWCGHRGYIYGEPWVDVLVRQPRPGPQRESFTHEEYERIRDAALALHSFLHFPVVLAWATGWALQDCCLLRWCDVDLPEMHIKIFRLKSGCESHGYFQPGSDLFNALLERSRLPVNPKAWPNDPAKGWYYVDVEAAAEMTLDRLDRGGNHSKVRGVHDEIKRVWKKAGIKKGKTFHNFRSTMATVLGNNRVNPIVACRLLGHKSIASYARYFAHSDDEARSELARALREQRNKDEAAKLKAAEWKQLVENTQPTNQT